MSTTDTQIKENGTKYPDDLGGISTVDIRGTTQDQRDLLGQLNSEENQRLVPLIVYLSMIMFLGIPGNGVVYYVYRTLEKGTNYGHFILYLSAVDFCTCLFAIPFDLFTILNHYTYSDEGVCEFSRFLSSATLLTTGFLFILITVDRYRKVCKPYEWQIEHRMAKRLCIVMVVCGVLFAFPALIVYGKKTFLVPHLNLNATVCATDDSFNGTIYPLMYNLVIGVMTITGFVALISLYVIIGRAISNHEEDHFQSSVEMQTMSNTLDGSERSSGPKNERSLKRNSRHQTISSSSTGDRSDIFDDGNEEEDVSESTSTSLDRPTLTKNTHEERVSFETNTREGSKASKKSPKRSKSSDNTYLKPNSVSTYTNTGNTSVGSRLTLARLSDDHSIEPHNSHESASHNRRQLHSRKVTIIMSLITLACILSYLPLLLLKFIEMINKEFVASLPDEGKAIRNLFLRFVYFNSAVNPIIYGVGDKRFRNGCRRLFGCS